VSPVQTGKAQAMTVTFGARQIRVESK